MLSIYELISLSALFAVIGFVFLMFSAPGLSLEGGETPSAAEGKE